MKVTFVYRGANPFLRALVNLFADTEEVEAREIEDIPWESREDVQSLKKIIGDLEGVVVTDYTTEDAVAMLLGRPSLNAYEFLKWKIKGVQDIVVRLKPIVDEIRMRGKEPVVLQNFLGHHIYDFMSFSGSEREKLIKIRKEMNAPHEGSQIIGEAVEAGDFYSIILQRELGVPIITRREFRHRSDNPWNVEGNVVKSLESLGLSPQKAVLLVDHHVNQIRDEKLAESGLAEVEIVPICPCCIGFEMTYDLSKAGFKLLFLGDYRRDELESAVVRLKQAIKAGNP